MRERLTAPAYASELREARAGGAVNVHACVGRKAWARASRSGHRPRLVVDLRHRSAASFDFTCCEGLELVLNASDCKLEAARAVAIRMCEHGARLVVLLQASSAPQFFYGVRS
jgi:hypothetical protein